MTLQTRRPTGLAPWPVTLLAGREKAGKTWAALKASASPLIDRTFYVGIGENDPDEYSLIPDVDFEIVEHDGTYYGILQALRDAAQEPRGEDGRPHLLVPDSMTRLWELIVDNAQGIANERAKGKKTASGDYAISPDLWNVAKAQWDDVMDAVRAFRGPVILTARLDEVMVMENGQPTKEKDWKIQAHKSLQFDVDVVVQMRERGKALITGTRSVRMALEKPVDAPGFTIDELWQRLGITADSVQGERTHSRTVTDDPSNDAAIDAWTARMKQKTTEAGIVAVWQEAVAAHKNGVLAREVLDALQVVASDFRNAQAQQVAGEPEPLASAGQKGPARQWLREARALTVPKDLSDLIQEATAAGASAKTVADMQQMLSTLSEPTVAAEPVTSWPTADLGQDAGWRETSDGGFAEADIPEDGAA